MRMVYKANLFQDIPMVLGVNADEGSMFVAMAWNNMDKLSKNWTYLVSNNFSCLRKIFEYESAT